MRIMSMNTDANSDQNLGLEAPVSLTPNQIAEAAGGAAAAVLVGPLVPLPIIFGGIWGPIFQGLGGAKMA
jgi:hypothetical protein